MSNSTLKRNVGIAGVSALASSATLVCCVLPAVLVSIGAGTTLVSLIGQFPQLIWLSQHKGWVFGLAGASLLASACVLYWQQGLPCPADPIAGRQCARLRRISTWMFGFALSVFLLGAGFAFVLPRLNA